MSAHSSSRNACPALSGGRLSAVEWTKDGGLQLSVTGASRSGYRVSGRVTLAEAKMSEAQDLRAPHREPQLLPGFRIESQQSGPGGTALEVSKPWGQGDSYLFRFVIDHKEVEAELSLDLKLTLLDWLRRV